VGVHSWPQSWLWDKVSYNQLRHRVPYTMFFYEYSLCCAECPVFYTFSCPGVSCCYSLCLQAGQSVGVAKPRLGVIQQPSVIKQWKDK
jgi:hypothetical protein